MLVVCSAFIALSQDPLPKRPKSSLGLIGGMGYVVESVEKGKPAEKAGLRTSDIVLEVSGHGFNSLDKFRALLQENTAAQLEVLRRETNLYRTEKIQLSTTPLFDKLGLNGFLAFVIQQVEPNSPASAAGFQPDDAILEVNGKPFSSAEEFRQLGLSEPGTEFILKVQRTDKSGTQRYNLAIKTGHSL
jgi:serine protease Do